MRLVIIILLLFYAMKATALSPAVRFEHLSINEGLSQSTVVSIVQDNQGVFVVWHRRWFEPV
jgi:hypothetical protein